jgi:hypothetical protein
MKYKAIKQENFNRIKFDYLKRSEQFSMDLRRNSGKNEPTNQLNQNEREDILKP